MGDTEYGHRIARKIDWLRRYRAECERLEELLEQARAQRDATALSLVDAGLSHRQVAEIAGFKNPYITALKRRRDAAA